MNLTGFAGTSNTRYRCRYRNRSRAYSILDYRSADSDSDYEYDNYNFLYDELNRNNRGLRYFASLFGLAFSGRTDRKNQNSHQLSHFHLMLLRL